MGGKANILEWMKIPPEGVIFSSTLKDYTCLANEYFKNMQEEFVLEDVSVVC